MFLKDWQKTAVFSKGKEISYNQLLTVSKNYSKIIPDNTTKVAIFSENRLEWLYVVYGAWFKEITFLPIDVLSTTEEIAYILKEAQPEIIFTSNEKEETLNSALSLVGIKDYKPQQHVFEKIKLPKYSPNKEIKPLIINDYNKTAFIIYTSGTTGSPKGVMLSFSNILFMCEAVSDKISIYHSEQRTLVLLPCHHILPLVGTLIIPLRAGGSIHFSPSLAPADIIETLQKYKTTIIIGVPRLYEMIIKGVLDQINAKGPIVKSLFYICGKLKSKYISKKVFKSVHEKFGGELKHLVCGGAAINPLAARAYEALGLEMLEGYGLTETSPMISFTRPNHVHPGSPGWLIDDMEIKNVDGEICVKGRNVMKGYYNNPEATKEVIKDGWFYTGDIGHVDKKGFLFITGRTKELLILSNGKNVNPEELERAFVSICPAIKEIGVYNKDDRIHAIIVPDEDILREKGINNYYEYFREANQQYNMKTSSYKKITHITVTTEDLPRTRLSKLKRFMLADMAKAKIKATSEIEEPKTEVYQQIKKFLESELDQNIYPDSHLELDVGLDSLGKISLQAYITNAFGITIDENDLSKYFNLLLLSEYVEENKKKQSEATINWAEILKEKISMKLPVSWPTMDAMKHSFKVIFKLYFRFRGRGMKNIPDEPCIFAPNHQSVLDGFLLISYLKQKTLKKTYFFAKAKHINTWWVRFFAHRNNTIVVDVEADLKASIQKLAVALKAGNNVIIFPEGTRSNDGELGIFKKTYAILSKELNVSVIPVAIKGAHKALPRGSRIPRPFKLVSVNFLKPIAPGKMSYEELNNSVRSAIQIELEKK